MRSAFYPPVGNLRRMLVAEQRERHQTFGRRSAIGIEFLPCVQASMNPSKARGETWPTGLERSRRSRRRNVFAALHKAPTAPRLGERGAVVLAQLHIRAVRV